jgi:hypothetical protein
MPARRGGQEAGDEDDGSAVALVGVRQRDVVAAAELRHGLLFGHAVE